MTQQQKFNRCCYCEKQINTKDFFNFRKCLNEHGKTSAHRICSTCWWGIIVPQSEDVHFRCFGCVKEWPLWITPKSKMSKVSQVIQID